MDFLFSAMQFIALALNAFGIILLAIAMIFYVNYFAPHIYLPKRNASFLVGIWMIVSGVNYVGGFINVAQLKLNLSFLFDLITYSQSVFLTLYCFSMHLHVKAFYELRLHNIVNAMYGKR